MKTQLILMLLFTGTIQNSFLKSAAAADPIPIEAAPMDDAIIASVECSDGTVPITEKDLSFLVTFKNMHESGAIEDAPIPIPFECSTNLFKRFLDFMRLNQTITSTIAPTPESVSPLTNEERVSLKEVHALIRLANFLELPKDLVLKLLIALHPLFTKEEIVAAFTKNDPEIDVILTLLDDLNVVYNWSVNPALPTPNFTPRPDYIGSFECISRDEKWAFLYALDEQNNPYAALQRTGIGNTKGAPIPLPHSKNEITNYSFSNDSKIFYYVTKESALGYTFLPTDNTTLPTFFVKQKVNRFALSANSKFLYCENMPDLIKTILDLSQSQETDAIEWRENILSEICNIGIFSDATNPFFIVFPPDEKTIELIDSRNFTSILHFTSDRSFGGIPANKHPIFSADYTKMAIYHRNKKKIFLFNLQTPKMSPLFVEVENDLNLRNNSICSSMTFSSDGSLFAWQSNTTTAQIKNLLDLKKQNFKIQNDTPIEKVFFCPYAPLLWVQSESTGVFVNCTDYDNPTQQTISSIGKTVFEKPLPFIKKTNSFCALSSDNENKQPQLTLYNLDGVTTYPKHIFDYTRNAPHIRNSPRSYFLYEHNSGTLFDPYNPLQSTILFSVSQFVGQCDLLPSWSEDGKTLYLFENATAYPATPTREDILQTHDCYALQLPVNVPSKQILLASLLQQQKLTKDSLSPQLEVLTKTMLKGYLPDGLLTQEAQDEGIMEE